MKKILYSLVVLIFQLSSISELTAQQNWFWQNPVPQGNTLRGVSFADANNGTAVGNFGTIIHTANGGITWTNQTSGTEKYLYAVSFSDANNGTAVGYYGTIIHTIDGGKTWVPQSSGKTNTLYGVSFTNANNGTAVGSYGTILRTTNGGQTWVAQSSGTTSSLNAVSFTDENHGTIVGNQGKILRTTNGGQTWVAQSSGTTKNLNGISFYDSNNGIAVGSDGTILRTNNGGAVWTPLNITTRDLFCVSYIDADNCTIGGKSTWIPSAYYYESTVIRLTNAGTSWKISYKVGDNDFYGVSNNTLVGDEGEIYHTSDDGTTWTAQRTGPVRKLRGVSFANSNIGTAVGHNGTILHTTNGGTSWISRPYTSPTTNGSIMDYLKAVSFADENNGFIVSGTGNSDGSILYYGSDGLILHTTNGGTTWYVQYNNSDAAFNGVSSPSANTCIAVGVYKIYEQGTYVDYAGWASTTDGGANWRERYFTNITDPLTDVSFVNNSIGTLVGHNGRIMRTTDGAFNWNTQNSRTTKNLHGVCFTDANTGTVVGDDGTILRTTNGGAFWSTQSSGTSEDLYGVFFTDVNNGTVVGSSGTILITTNGGTTWINQMIITDQDLFGVSFSHLNNGNVVGDNGTILRTTDGSVAPEDDLQFTTLADMNDARYGAGYTFDGNYIYSICGGIIESPWKSTNIERYDLASNTWTEFITDLIPRRYCSAEYVPSQNKIYIFNGDTYTGSTYTDTVEIVDVLTGELSYSATNPYPVTYGGSAVWQNRIYLFGGRNSDGVSNRLYEFDPQTNNWTRLPDMPEAKQTNGEIINGVLYVFGGYDGTTSKRIDAYNIQNSTWTALGEMPVGISTHATAKSGKDIWLVGSYDDIKFLAVYDTVANNFTQLTSNMIGRRHAGAVVVEDNLYIFGGNQASSNASTLKSLEFANISDDVVSVNNEDNQVINNVVLNYNYPNPFNPITTIRYSIPEFSFVSIKIFNVLGKEIATLINTNKSIGNHQVIFDATSLSSGMYFYRLQVGDFVETKKMILMK